MALMSRFSTAFRAFFGREPTTTNRNPYTSSGYAYRPDRLRLSRGNERSIITAIYNRIAIDAAAIDIRHVRLDSSGRYIEDIQSPLQNCLTLEANLDQSAREFRQDVYMSMMDEGCVAIVPILTDKDPDEGTFEIYTMRTGKITEWFPKDVRVKVYNEDVGRQEENTTSKLNVAIIENPLYAVMNEHNSTMQRLARKLLLLDVVDEQTSSGKLDLIIQLPYVIKTTGKKEQAMERRTELENQLTNSKYGIGYTDGSEKITQLNRPIENNLMTQIEYLIKMAYSQLGITTSIMDGTADEATMLNYYNRTIEPFVAAVVDNTKRKFLSQTARTRLESIVFFRDPFKLVPINSLAEIADKFSRNAIVSTNEFRQVIGMKPSKDPKADELSNKNISEPAQTSKTELPVAEKQAIGTQTDTPVINTGPITLEEFLSSINSLDSFDNELSLLEEDMANDDVKHYSSELYDPVKAHEYYEKTKELKGRTSTSGLNETGKAAAKYVKEQLKTEKKTKVEAEKISVKQEIESFKTQMQAKIDSIKNVLKNMSTENKALYREDIKIEIAALRDDNAQMRVSLQEEFKCTKADLKEVYDEKYVQELSKIKDTSSMVKKK